MIKEDERNIMNMIYNQIIKIEKKILSNIRILYGDQYLQNGYNTVVNF